MRPARSRSLPPGFLKSARRLIQAAVVAEREGALETNTYDRYSRKCNRREALIIESVIATIRADLHRTLYLGNLITAAVPGVSEPNEKLSNAHKQLKSFLRIWFPDADEAEIELLARQRQDYERHVGIKIDSEAYKEAEKHAEDVLRQIGTKDVIAT